MQAFGLAVLCLVYLFFIPTSNAIADDELEVAFSATPNKCVTLQEGQPCFVRVKFKWATVTPMELCITDAEAILVKCWHLASEGSVVLPQSLPATSEFVLINSEGQELGRTVVEVSWVYRIKRSKRRWRLF